MFEFEPSDYFWPSSANKKAISKLVASFLDENIDITPERLVLLEKSVNGAVSEAAREASLNQASDPTSFTANEVVAIN